MEQTVTGAVRASGWQLQPAAAVMHLGRRFAQSAAMRRLVRAVGRTSPYTAIALTLPGGSIIALALLMLEGRTGSAVPLRRALLIAAAGTALMLPA